MTVSHTQTGLTLHPQPQLYHKIINTNGHMEGPADSACLLLNDFVPYPSLDTPTHNRCVTCMQIAWRAKNRKTQQTGAFLSSDYKRKERYIKIETLY